MGVEGHRGGRGGQRELLTFSSSSSSGFALYCPLLCALLLNVVVLVLWLSSEGPSHHQTQPGSAAQPSDCIQGRYPFPSSMPGKRLLIVITHSVFSPK